MNFIYGFTKKRLRGKVKLFLNVNSQVLLLCCVKKKVLFMCNLNYTSGERMCKKYYKKKWYDFNGQIWHCYLFGENTSERILSPFTPSEMVTVGMRWDSPNFDIFWFKNSKILIYKFGPFDLHPTPLNLQQVKIQEEIKTLVNYILTLST
jgi:hypothetical protein